MGLKIGAQLYTVRNFCQTLEEFEKTCVKIKNIGYKYVQLSGIGDFPAQSINEVLERSGLKAVCTHRNPKSYLENPEEEIRFHKILGCDICGISTIPAENVKKETIDEFAKNFMPVVQRLKEAGLTFAYHNHALEFEKIGNKYVIDVILEKFGKENIKLIFDIYWAAYSGVSPENFIREHADSIACLHMKDLKVSNNEVRFVEVGKGNLDWDKIISACEEAGIEYALVEQDICDKNPFDSLKISYDFLKEKGLA